MTATDLIGESEIVLTDGTLWHEGDEMSHDTEGGMISILSLPEYQIDEDHLGWCVEHGWVTATRYLLELAENWVSRCFGPDARMGTFGELPSDPPHTYESHARHGVYWRGAVEACLVLEGHDEYPEALPYAQIVLALTDHLEAVDILDCDEAEALRAQPRFDVYRVVPAGTTDVYALGEELNYYPTWDAAARGIEEHCDANSWGQDSDPSPEDWDIIAARVDAAEYVAVARRCSFDMVGSKGSN